MVHEVVISCGLESGLGGAGAQHRGSLEDWVGEEGGDWQVDVEYVHLWINTGVCSKAHMACVFL